MLGRLIRRLNANEALMQWVVGGMIGAALYLYAGVVFRMLRLPEGSETGMDERIVLSFVLAFVPIAMCMPLWLGKYGSGRRGVGAGRLKANRVLITWVVGSLFWAAFCLLTTAALLGWHPQAAPPPWVADMLGGMVAIIFAPIGLCLAAWRSQVAYRQQEIARKTMETAHRHQVVQARASLDQRFEKGVELLCQDRDLARMGGLTILENLSRANPEEYTVQAMDMVAKFVRHSLSMKAHMSIQGDADGKLKGVSVLIDVQAAMEVISGRKEKEIQQYARKSGNAGLNLRMCFFGNWMCRAQSFRYVDFGESHIEQSRFRKCDFSHASLVDMTMDCPDFIDSSFENANLARAYLGGSSMEKCNLKSAILKETVFSSFRMGNCDLRGAKGHGAKFDKADVRNCDLSEAEFMAASFKQAEFMKARFRGADLSGADLSGALLEDADLSHANLSKTNLRGASLIGANLMGARLDGAMLDGANFTDASNLTDRQLESAEIPRGKAGGPILLGQSTRRLTPREDSLPPGGGDEEF